MPRNWLIRVLTFILPYFAFSQTNVSDSLYKRFLHAGADSVKCSLLLDLVNEYRFNDPDTSFYFLDKHDAICRKHLQKSSLKEESVFISLHLQSLNFRAGLNDLIGEVDEAEALYRKCIELGNKYNRQSEVASGYNSLGTLLFVRGDQTNGTDCIQKALAIYRTLNDSIGIGGGLNDLGYIFQQSGKMDLAMEKFKESLEINTKTQNKPNILSNYVNIGYLYSHRSEYHKAMEFYRLALTLGNEIHDDEVVGVVYSNMAQIYFEYGDLEKAEELFLKSLAIRNKLENTSGISNLFNNLGVVNKTLNRNDKALEYFHRSLELQKELDDKESIAITWSNIGNIYYNLRLYDSSMSAQRRGLEILTSAGQERAKVNMLTNIGNIYMKQFDFTKAKQTYEVAMNLALKMKIPRLIRSTSTGIATAARCMNPEQSVEMTLQTLDMWQKEAELNLAYMSDKEKEIYLNGTFPERDNFYSLCLDLQEKRSDLIIKAYELTSFNKGLLARSSNLQRNKILHSKDTTLSRIYAEWLNIRRQLAQNYARGLSDPQLEELCESKERQISVRSELFKDLSQLNNITCKEVQTALKKGEALINFITFNRLTPENSEFSKVYCAIIITPDRDAPLLIELCKESELASALRKSGSHNLDMVNAIYGNRNNPNTKVYTLIWMPLEKYLKETSRVYVNPSGLLYQVAFAALLDKEKRYLSEKLELNIINSDHLLLSRNEIKPSESDSFCLFGGINYNLPADTSTVRENGWTYLPGTFEEVKKIEYLLKRKKVHTEIHTGVEATESIFKQRAGHVQFLHIATHGFFYPSPNLQTEELENLLNNTNDKKTSKKESIVFRGNSKGYWTFIKNKNPMMRSGLAFSGANGVWLETDRQKSNDDGVLTAQEAADLDLSATKLLILSACETGLGDVKGSEGVYGLQRAFKMAGVQNIVMSLWQVPDKETAEFMNLFYKNLSGNKSVKNAFKKTQSILSKKYDPYYWAAFVLLQ